MSDPDEVMVWLVPASAAVSVEGLLTPNEHERAARFVNDRARQTWVAARGGLRLLLGRCLSCAPASVSFEVAEGGKPFVRGRPLEFNVSHSGDLAAIAVAAAGRPVGVDVEQQRPVQHQRGVAEHIMTSAELARYVALPEHQRQSFVLWVWARKEALVKATGEGMATALATFACEPPAASPWKVVDVHLTGYAAAVAACGRHWSFALQEIEPDL